MGAQGEGDFEGPVAAFHQPIGVGEGGGDGCALRERARVAPGAFEQPGRRGGIPQELERACGGGKRPGLRRFVGDDRIGRVRDAVALVDHVVGKKIDAQGVGLRFPLLDKDFMDVGGIVIRHDLYRLALSL